MNLTWPYSFYLLRTLDCPRSLVKTKLVVNVSGECELLALAMCNDRKEALELLKEVSMISGIENAESYVILEIIKLSGRNLK